MLHLLLWEGLDRHAPTSPRTPAASRRCATAVRDFTPQRRGAGSAASTEADLVQAARWFGRAHDADAVAVLPGPEPEQQRHRQERRADQPAPGHRADRQARRRAVLADRPAQRDGRARGRRPGQPAVARTATWPTPSTAPRWRALWGVADVPAQPGKTRGRDVPGRGRRRDQGAVDRLHQPGAVDARPGHGAPRAASAAEFVVRAGGLRHHRHLRLRRPAAAGHHLGREGRHRHQQRAPHQPRARAPCRRPGEARDDWAHRRRLRAPARSAPAGAPQRRRAALFPYADAESVWNEHRDTTRGRDLDITGLSYAALEQRRSSGPAPKAPTEGRARLYEDGVFATADGRARFADAGLRSRWPSRATRAIPFSLTTGRLRDQWHGMSRTGTLGRLFGHARRAGASRCTRRTWRAAAGRRRPGARAARAAARSCCRCSASDAVRAGAGLHRHALGRGVRVGPRADGAGWRRQRADHAGLLPAVEAARAEARGGAASKAELPWQTAGRRLAAARTRRWRLRERAARPVAAASPTPRCVPFGREPDGRVGVLFRAAPRSAGRRRWLHASKRCSACTARAVLRYADARARPAPRDAPGRRRRHACRPSCWPATSAAQAWVLAAAAGRTAGARASAARCWPRAGSRRSRWRRAARRSAAASTSAKTQIVAALAPCDGDARRAPGSSCRHSCAAAPNCGSCLPALRVLRAAASATRGGRAP